jgi:hypothetical protein
MTVNPRWLIGSKRSLNRLNLLRHNDLRAAATFPEALRVSRKSNLTWPPIPGVGQKQDGAGGMTAGLEWIVGDSCKGKMGGLAGIPPASRPASRIGDRVRIARHSRA